MTDETPPDTDMTIEEVDIDAVDDEFIPEESQDEATDDTNDEAQNASADDATAHAGDADVEMTAGEEKEADEEEPERWELKAIVTAAQLRQATIRCGHDHCRLQACSFWCLNKDPDNLWSSCLDCQVADYEGWPEDVGEIPLKVLRGEHWEMILERCTADRETAIMPNIPKEGFDAIPSNNTTTHESIVSPSQEQPSDEAGEELWELKEIMTAADLAKSKAKRCNTENCSLVACSAWASNLSPNEYWYACVDCQLNDFEGFPPLNELPVEYLSEENRKLILEKCTNDAEKAALPDLPTSPSLLATVGGDPLTAAITPPPGHDEAVAAGQSNIVVGAVTKGGKGGKKSVTPMPDGSSKDKSKGTNKASKEALAIHKKWQAEAVKLGGPDVKIEVSKPKAKKLIFDMLHDSFRPMNITEVYQKLKAIVPKPILTACLDDMADTFQGNPFAEADSDDEDEKPAKKKAKKSNDATDDYSGSLRLKHGRNTNNNLYYVDHTKLQNNGNGLDPDKRNDLYSNLEKAKCEEEELKKQLQTTAAEIGRLLSEPLNDELTTMLVEEEKEMEELNEKLETNRAFAGNEKYAKQLSSRVSKMAAFWRKRKRQCMDFLSMMEESTEGTISIKKCLKGDGQIDIDSDESAIKGAMAYANTKKNSKFARKSLNGRTSSGATAGLNPDPNFIGVTLNSGGNPERVYLEDK